MSLEVNYKHIKVTRGKKLTTQPKNIFFCKYTQMTIRSHIGYVRLVKKISKVNGSHTRSKACFQ